MDRLADTIRGQLQRLGPQADLAALVERWPAVVGKAIACNAWPARIGRDGTVHANAADSIWAFELTQRATDIARRLGVAAIRFAPGPLAGPDQPPASASVALPSPEQVRAAAEIAAAIASRELRDAVAKAVGLSLARGASDRPV